MQLSTFLLPELEGRRNGHTQVRVTGAVGILFEGDFNVILLAIQLLASLGLVNRKLDSVTGLALTDGLYQRLGIASRFAVDGED